MTNTIVCVDACLIKRKNSQQTISLSDEVLLLYRRSTGFMDGTFCLPGGKPQATETAQEAIARELFEELGITVKVQDITFLHAISIKRTPHNYLCLTFVIETWSGELINKEPKKHEYFEWYSLNNLPDKLMSGHRQALLHALKQSYYSELDLAKPQDL